MSPVRESELEEAEQPPHPVIVDLGAIVQVVEESADSASSRRATPALIVDFALRRIVTSTLRKCAIHFCRTRQSASSAGWPRLRLIARSCARRDPSTLPHCSSRGHRDRRCAPACDFLQQLAEAAEAARRREELDRRLSAASDRAVVGHRDLLVRNSISATRASIGSAEAPGYAGAGSR
jgi:hypothetical protein